ncbi:MAG: hypothetical protein HKM06_07495 [Spirochaetales bacterium]|nr:hypothetical protein [Spirochaetales bacterium]
MNESEIPFPKFLKTFDEQGRVSHEDYMEDEGKRGLCFFGYATSVNETMVKVWLAEYDCLGRNTKLIFFDSEGIPCSDSRKSFSNRV